MSEQVKINPDLSIILVGSVINKLISEYEGELPDNRAYIPVDHFITLLNETTRKYTQDFPNDEINFPQIDIKLLSFIINRTLYFKFVSVTNDSVIVEVGDKYENYLKNIVATSTFRYSKFLLNGAKQLYKLEQESAKGNEEVSEVTEEVKDEESTDNVIVQDTDEQSQSVEKESNDIEEDKQSEEEVKGKEVQETVAEEDAELVSPEIEDLSQVNEDTSEIAEIEQKELEEKADPTNDEKEKENVQQETENAEAEAVEADEVSDESKHEVPAVSIEEANQEDTETVEQENDQNKEGVEDQEQPEAQPEQPEAQPEQQDHESKVEEVESTSSPDKETRESASTTPMATEAQEPSEEKSVEIISPEPEPLVTKSELPSRKRPRSHSPAPAQHQKRFQNIAVNLINSIQEHRFSSPFLQAVNPKDAPNYYEMIYEPKNLKGIQKALKSKSDPPAYSSIKELERDVMLMFANCIMYNRSDEDLVELTRTMKRDVEEMFQMFKQAESEMK
ncbi:hypothetical protein I9W82_003338 [Candida metapsilosis]|uniref:Bromo domain-containing protein n=1 Tax=Candida metapsilosis TaxID=273372 RepID=A0A8H8DC62_9ASCO|nr:hypothetical protein I9W82_003338 [Candida metapsilosis]